MGDDRGQPPRPNTQFLNQFLGMLAGLGIGVVVANRFPQITARMGFGNVLLWGAVLGASVASFRQFESAGAVLTRRKNRSLNLAVGFGLPIGLLLIASLLLN